MQYAFNPISSQFDIVNLGTGSAANLIATVPNINAQVVANTPLYTVPSGKTFICTGATIRCTSATAITNGPTLGIGNIAGTNNIFASTAINALTTISNVFGFELVGMSVSTAANGIVYLNLSSPSSGTAQIIAVDLEGYLL